MTRNCLCVQQVGGRGITARSWERKMGRMKMDLTVVGDKNVPGPSPSLQEHAGPDGFPVSRFWKLHLLRVREEDREEGRRGEGMKGEHFSAPKSWL